MVLCGGVDARDEGCRGKNAGMRGRNEDLKRLYERRVGLVIHPFHNADDFPRAPACGCEPPTDRLRWIAKRGSEPFSDDRDLRTATHFRVVEFAAVQDLPTHGLKIVREYGNDHRIAFRGMSVDPEASSDESLRVQRQEFSGTGAANSGKSPHTVQYFLEIRELAVVRLIGCAVQRHAYRGNAVYVVTAVGTHETGERMSDQDGC